MFDAGLNFKQNISVITPDIIKDNKALQIVKFYSSIFSFQLHPIC
jgi:hypothetical protein